MKKIFITIIFILIFAPTMSLAAALSVLGDKNEFTLSEEFLVEVFVDTEDVSVNAVEGLVKFPANLLSLKEVREGNSSINFWVEKPALGSEGEVSFSGITTGGFSGSSRFLFSLVFETKAIGSGQINLRGVQVLQNDGLGTKVKTRATPLSFSVSKDGSGERADLQVIDTESPESFSPFIARDASIFDGQYFVVFSTVDKGVGIDRFEVREGLWSDYVTAQSPYLLTDQSLTKKIYVRAFDKAGNQRTEDIQAENVDWRFLFGIILGIILIVCLWSYGHSRKNLRKFFKRQ